MAHVIEIYRCDIKPDHSMKRPLFISPVKAGFPSPAEDHVDKKLDLNELLIKHPAATFFVRVSGDSMMDAGIRSGDLLVVDKSLEASDGHIVVAILNDEFTVKRLSKHHGQVFLCPENETYKKIEITEEDRFSVWGVVTSVIHQFVSS